MCSRVSNTPCTGRAPTSVPGIHGLKIASPGIEPLAVASNPASRPPNLPPGHPSQDRRSPMKTFNATRPRLYLLLTGVLLVAGCGGGSEPEQAAEQTGQDSA